MSSPVTKAYNKNDVCLNCPLPECIPTGKRCPLYNTEDSENRELILKLLESKEEDKKVRNQIRDEIERVKQMGKDAEKTHHKTRARLEIYRLKELEKGLTRKIKNLSAQQIAAKMNVSITIVNGMDKRRVRL